LVDIHAGMLLAGRYEVQSPISRGAIGTVHRALDHQVGDEVALKRLTDFTQVARFEIEARLLALLDHPRVVKVIDHFQEPSSGYFIVMDLVRGFDLAEVLRQRGTPGLSVELVLEYTHQACEALDYVHEQRIVHRDVKPENLILGEQGVILVDFGVARQLDAEDPDEVGTVGVGTPRYMAPEIFAGGTVSERSDVFSLAATVSTLLCGQLPSYGDRRALSERVPGVSVELSDAVRAGMEFLPEKRIATIAAFAKAIGRPIRGRTGHSFVRASDPEEGKVSLIGALVRTAAGVLDSAAASIALVDPATNELVFHAAWGPGADDIVGVRLSPGVGIAGSVVASGEPTFIAECRADPRFAAQIAANTGHVPNTMLVVPLRHGGQNLGVMSLLDRRDGMPYGGADVSRAMLFAELAVIALAVGPEA